MQFIKVINTDGLDVRIMVDKIVAYTPCDRRPDVTIVALANGGAGEIAMPVKQFDQFFTQLATH